MVTPNFNNQPPIKTYAETDIIKDSGIWEYLQYLQLNRINFLATTIWDERVSAANKLLNMVSAIDQLEFLCIDKLQYSDKFISTKPIIFKNLVKDTLPLERLIEGDAYKQLQLKLMMSEWLKAINPALSRMKKIKRTSFISGEGEQGNLNDDQ